MSESTITISGKVYDEATLPEKSKQLIAIYRKWNQELLDSRLETSKLEAALRELSREVVESVNDVAPISAE